jgi:hypothetical protein
MKCVCVLTLLAMSVGTAAQVLTGQVVAPASHAPGANSNGTAPIHAALPALDQAYRAAEASGDTAELIALADTVRQLGRVARDPTFNTTAVEMYRTALLHARREASLDGVLRIAEGFGELGDREDLRESVRIAERLAGGDREAEGDVREIISRFADQLRQPEGEAR